ncbi:MAG: DAK2 domain-containing protein [Butyrivibrio sp.]|nr:DAK2 domain-containing protein [Butyrivibrio sp.]
MNISILKNMLAGAAQSISSNKEKLNSLNVFPIPDGDTGTNMEKTILGAIGAIAEIGERELTPEDMGSLYEGVLMASQGNSGVILSQWFKGFFASLGDIEADEFDALALNNAFMNGVEAAYDAVVSPVEGTILTVARETYEECEESITEETTVEDYLRLAAEVAKKSLANTPNLLAVLKEAGVVDSGGFGFVCMLTGMLGALDKSAGFDADEFVRTASPMTAAADTGEFGYCTELIVKLDSENGAKFNIKKTVDFLNYVGNSVVTVTDGNKLKLHVHTLKPEAVLKYCHQFGEFIKIKIENMTIQHQETLLKEKEKCAVIAVADGTGVGELFTRLGASRIVDGGQSDNVSTNDFIKAIDSVMADDIIILPNNSNIIMVAEQVQKMCEGINIHIVRTHSMAEGYSALSILNKDDSVEKIIGYMNEEISGTVTGTVCPATRDACIDGVEIHVGHYIAMSGKTIVADCANRADAVLALFGGIQGIEDKESVLVICRDEVLLGEVKALEPRLEKLCRGAEIYYLCGGQSVYDYVFAIQ